MIDTAVYADKLTCCDIYPWHQMARPPSVFFLVYTSTIHAELNVLHYKHATAQMFFFLVYTSTIHAKVNVLHYKHATAQMFLEGSLPIMHLV